MKPIESLAAFDPFAVRRTEGGAGHRYLLLDVFTRTPLQGNQLAVFTDGRSISPPDMQRLARELKLSESVFVLPASAEPADGADVAVRIFTPSAELPFAGHPVLGTAAVVGSALGRERVTLKTGAGAVTVTLSAGEGRARSGWMRQPVPTWAPYEREGELLAALGVEGSGLPVEVYENGPRHVFVELESEQAVAELRPDLGALEGLGEIGVSCFAGEGHGWKTRMFAPGLGVPEDPATGSAAGPLVLHLCRHGRIEFGAEIEISQGTEIERPSLLLACAQGSAEQVESVQVGGSAVIVGRGEFLID
jgi:trans-2,3-dihydro-3-hydroxyanthranilate isomerase